MDSRNPHLLEFCRAIGFLYPMRWADDETTLGDFDGRGQTIDVFNLQADRQRQFFRDTRAGRRALEASIGAALTLVFHTPDATSQHYGHLFPKLSGAEFSGELVVNLSPGGAGETSVVRHGIHVLLEEAA